MSDYLLLGIAGMLALLGCIALALSLKGNWRLVTGASISPPCKKTARRAGWLLLSLALLACIISDGIGFAALIWPLLFAVASGIVAMTLSFQPNVLKVAARICQKFAEWLSA